MRWFVKELTHLKRGYAGLAPIIKDLPRIECGWGNGYVILDSDHPFHGVDYDTIHERFPELEVHGGLTCASEVDYDKIDAWDELIVDDLGGWMIGFDCAHFNDNEYNWPKYRVEQEAENLYNQMKNYAETTVTKTKINSKGENGSLGFNRG